MTMKVLFLLCASSIWALPSQVKDRVPQDVEVNDAVEGELPWEVIFSTKDGSGSIINWSSGSLISKQWVLTSASSLQGAVSADVYAGSVKLSQYSESQVAETFILHENYKRDSLSNNIGVMKLNEPWPFDYYVETVALVSSDYQVGTNVDLSVNTWVKSDKHLIYFTITTISNDQCGESSDVICAANVDLPYSTTADSGDGSPVIVTEQNYIQKQVAIANFVKDGGAGQRYTKISSYRDWIKGKTGI